MLKLTPAEQREWDEFGTLDGMTPDQWRQLAWVIWMDVLRAWAGHATLVLGAVVLLLMF